MKGQSTCLTCEQLYQKVWYQSVSSLAKKIGISDVGLAKICKHYNIPRPGLGYWAKKQAGIKVPNFQVCMSHNFITIGRKPRIGWIWRVDVSY